MKQIYRFLVHKIQCAFKLICTNKITVYSPDRAIISSSFIPLQLDNVSYMALACTSKQSKYLWVLTWGFFLLHRDLPDQWQQRKQQSEELLSAGQLLRAQTKQTKKTVRLLSRPLYPSPFGHMKTLPPTYSFQDLILLQMSVWASLLYQVKSHTHTIRCAPYLKKCFTKFFATIL